MKQADQLEAECERLEATVKAWPSLEERRTKLQQRLNQHDAQAADLARREQERATAELDLAGGRLLRYL